MLGAHYLQLRAPNDTDSRAMARLPDGRVCATRRDPRAVCRVCGGLAVAGERPGQHGLPRLGSAHRGARRRVRRRVGPRTRDRRRLGAGAEGHDVLRSHGAETRSPLLLHRPCRSMLQGRRSGPSNEVSVVAVRGQPRAQPLPRSLTASPPRGLTSCSRCSAPATAGGPWPVRRLASTAAPRARCALPRGTPVTLAASAAPGHRFVGWQGAECSGDGSCAVTLEHGNDRARHVRTGRRRRRSFVHALSRRGRGQRLLRHASRARQSWRTVGECLGAVPARRRRRRAARRTGAAPFERARRAGAIRRTGGPGVRDDRRERHAARGRSHDVVAHTGRHDLRRPCRDERGRACAALVPRGRRDACRLRPVLPAAEPARSHGACAHPLPAADRRRRSRRSTQLPPQSRTNVWVDQEVFEQPDAAR